jgi:aminoglycoside phosphotransferase
MRYSRDRRGPPGWLLARDALLRAARLRAGPGARLETGRVSKLAEGLSREVFVAELTVSPDPTELSGGYAMLVPRRDEGDEVDARTRREAILLERLRCLLPSSAPFQVPGVLGAPVVVGRTVLVRDAVPGFTLKLREGACLAGPPWQVVGELAAAVHGLDAAALTDTVPGHATRREHAAAFVAEAFEGLGAEAGEARGWAVEHLPPPEPSALLHGDLLGQNILATMDGPPVLIDWELARRGDPAYDLAIVTRGVRRPFGVEHGLERLLAAYHAAGGHPVTAREVRPPEKMEAIARYVMDKLDVPKHYAVMVGHADRKHAHFHLRIDHPRPQMGSPFGKARWRKGYCAIRHAERHIALSEARLRTATHQSRRRSWMRLAPAWQHRVVT